METLPIIDLKTFTSESDLAAELMRVGKDPGFFYVIGHGIGDEAISPIFKLAENFFNTPLMQKSLFHDGSGDLGYTGMQEETLSGSGSGDVKESFYLSHPGKGDRQLLPVGLEKSRGQLAQFFTSCEELSQQLLRAIAIGLSLPRDYLSKAHTGECCRMRLINYPAISSRNAHENGGNDVRAGEHTDYGSLTLLFRQPCDQGGLQVRRNSQWVDVPCLKDAVVVNIGDALEFWTAGRLRSTIHRVAFPRSASENVRRLSIPVFIQPDRNVLLAPLKGTSGEDHALPEEFLEVLKRKGYASVTPMTSKDHLAARVRSTYIKA